jgi:hypothetical protein
MRASRFLALVFRQKLSSSRLGLELGGPLFAAHVVADLHGISIEFINGKHGLSFVWPFASGDVHRLGRGFWIAFHRPFVGAFTGGHCVLVAVDHQLDHFLELISQAGAMRYLPIALALLCAGILQVLALEADVTFGWGFAIVILQTVASVIGAYIVSLLFGLVLEYAEVHMHGEPSENVLTPHMTGEQGQVEQER